MFVWGLGQNFYNKTGTSCPACFPVQIMALTQQITWWLEGNPGAHMGTRRRAQDLDALARVCVADNTLPYYRPLLLQSNQKEEAIT